MADIDRLIDEGLNRYGSGDLDGALEAWEEALAIDPENPQANSYVDYVRQNYDILATDGGAVVTDGGTAPFAIEPEPEYTIEIVAGEVGTSTVEPHHADDDGLEHGWFIDDDDPHTVRVGRVPSRDLPRTVEIEADEPPQQGISFDDTTREYHNQKPPTDEFADEPSFKAESTPLGFGTQDTEIKKRNTGFVQPVPRTATTNLPLPSPGGEPPTSMAELRVRLRTPSSMPPVNKLAEDDVMRKPIEPAPLEPASTPPPPPPPSDSPPSLELEPIDPIDPFGAVDPLDALDDLPPLELAPPDRRTKRSAPPPMAALVPEPAEPPAPSTENGVHEETTGDDLLGSLPVPRRLTPVRGSRASVPPPDELELELEPGPRIPTRDLPAPRPPADVAVAAAKTRDLAREGAEPDAPDAHDDLGLEVPTARRRNLGGPIGGDDPVIGIPTRELGLRPPAGKRAPSIFPDEDATTTQSDASQIRREARERTVSDDILEEIDSGTPAGESKDDHVRRRISGLLMRASEWNASGELDKAVTAVELAMSEDPTSALAQKLVHRNREAIMNVFQTYLGDLDRQPQLAKPLHELANAPISSRAAFLLSRIDGMLSIDEILDVSGMPRLEAYRHLCQLFLRGILR